MALDVPHEMRDKIMRLLDELGIMELNPVQEQALKTGYLHGRNLVVASPTGSGKTLIAKMAVFNKRKVVYTCPLRALANEKYNEFRVFERFGKRVAISIGDLDSSDPWLEDYDIIITTNEKLDSLMRHHSPWLKKVDLLIVDEVHLIDTDRGPTLENVIMRFRCLYPKTQIIALSATIPNADELGDWLDAEVVKSDWRPVKLELGVYLDGVLETTEGTYEIEQGYKDELKNVVNHFLSEGKNILIFATTRKSAESIAEQLKPLVRRYCVNNNKCEDLSKAVLSALETPTKQCKRLANCVLDGVGFHHAGLVNEQRSAIEDAFRENVLRVICSTPTLAMGVNLPADVVIMRSMYRYSGSGGMRPIPKREFFQCAGRAGRPQYSEKGIAVMLAKSEPEKETFWDEYILGEPESVNSRMSSAPILRTHVLASIAMGVTQTMEKLTALFMHSFMAFQYGDTYGITALLERAVTELEEWDFVEINKERIVATGIGKRVSELYIDPYSAKKIIDKLSTRDMGELGWLYLIADTYELWPYVSARSREEEKLLEDAQIHEDELGFSVYEAYDSDYNFLSKFKTALMLRDWINEKTEEEILERYNIAPGILRGYVSNAEWIAYATGELAKLLRAKDKETQARKIQRRIKYGVREELLPLVVIRGIGRIRARRLYNIGIRNIADIKRYKDKNILTNILGKKLYERIVVSDND